MWKPYKPSQIANFLIHCSLNDTEQNGPLSPMKLQKIIYYAHGWHLAFYDRPLIDEPIQAWTYGPVIMTLYHQTKRFGNRPIRQQILDEEQEGDLDLETKDFLKKIWDIFKVYTAIQLANATHKQGTPWKQKQDEEIEKYGKIRLYVDLDDELIKAYFKNRTSSKKDGTDERNTNERHS